ncbi:MAG: prephenate dehydrogenase [Anaerolineae bacterium]|nr:prephenate dehydrogenase [Anaerolineae bacterium]
MATLLDQCRVHIVGLGLMGASLAMALRGKVRRITAEDITPHVIEAGVGKGVIDAAGSTRDADIVILAIPAHHIITLIPALNLRPGTLVLDLGSTKTRICEALDRLLPGVMAVGGHPMCGLAENGYANAIPTLYEGARFVLCETRRTTDEARVLAEAMARAVGSQPLWMDRARQDQLTALTSHLPHVLSFVLMRLAMDGSVEDSALYELAAGGFDGATRLARTDAAMIVGMFSTNADQIRQSVAQLRDHLDRLEAMLDDPDMLDSELDAIVDARRAYTDTYGERLIT